MDRTKRPPNRLLLGLRTQSYQTIITRECYGTALTRVPLAVHLAKSYWEDARALNEKCCVLDSQEKLTSGAEIPKRKSRSFIVFLVLVAFSTSLYRLGGQSLWWDETLSVQRARGDLGYVLSNTIYIFNDATKDQHPPLYFLLLHFSRMAFGDSEFALRFLSLAFILLTVPLSYQAGKAVWNEHTGIFSALVAATSPFYVWYAQEARPYALVAMLTTLSTYLLLKLSWTKSKHFLAYYVVVTAALLATHYLTAIMIFAQALFFGMRAVRGKRSGAVGALIAVIAIGLAVLFGASYSIGRYLTQNGSPLEVPLVSVVRDIVVTFAFGVTVNQYSVVTFAAIIAVVAIAATIVGIRGQAREGLLSVWGCAIVALASVYLISQYKTVYGARYVIFLAPLYYLIIGHGGAQLQRLHPAIGAVFGLYLLGVGAFGSFDQLVLDHNYKQDYRGAAEYIAQHAKAGDAIVLDDRKIVTAFEYYNVGRYPLYGVPSYPRVDRSTVSTELRDIASRHPRVWLVLSMTGDIDPQGLTEAVLREEYYQIDARVLTGSTYSIGVYLFSTMPHTVSELPVNVVPTEANFDDQVVLAGYKIGKQDLPGNRLDLDLFWRSRGASLPRLAMFGQVVDREGNAWGSFDSEPFFGFFPTEQWRPGSLVADQREIWLPPGTPPGNYSLRLGVRNVQSGHSLPIKDNNGRISSAVMEIPNALVIGGLVGGDRKAIDFSQRYGAKFGDLVTLLAGDSLSRSMVPGQELSFRLLWQSEVAQPEDLDVEFWLDNSKGERMRVTSAPLSPAYPVNSWRNGQIVSAYYSFTVPASANSGNYNVELAVRRHNSAARLGARFGLNPFEESLVDLGTVSVTAPAHRFAPPESIIRVGANLHDTAELSGFTIANANGVSAITAQGTTRIDITPLTDEPLGVTLWWKAMSELHVNYSVFAQVLDSGGQLVDQDDGFPSNGKRPTSGWVANEFIEDGHVLSKINELPKGRYTLVVGMYDSSTGQRLELLGRTQDFIRIAEIAIH